MTPTTNAMATASNAVTIESVEPASRRLKTSRPT